MRQARLSFPITKATPQPDGRLLVEGTATSDSIDSQDERLLFDGSVEALSKWLETGPAVRESHDPHKAVGRGLEMIADAATKSIGVRVFVSAGAQDTQAKVLDGTLAAFSVGGQPKAWAMKKEGKKQIREISAWDMSELSLVDRPANPDCTIDLVKNDHLTDAVGEGEEMAKAEQKPAPGDEEQKKPATDTPAPGSKPAEAAPPAKEEPPPAEKPEEGEPEEKAADAPVEAAEAPPAEQKKYASMKEAEEAVKADIEACNKEAEAFAAGQAKKRAAIAAAAEGFGLGAVVPKEWAAKPAKGKAKKSAESEMKKDDTAAFDVRCALDCLDMLNGLRSMESGEMGAEPPEQMTLLSTAIAALKAFIVSEAGELVAAEPAATVAAPVEEVAVVAASAAPEWVKSMNDRFVAIETTVASTAAIKRLSEKIDSIQKAADEIKALKRDLKVIGDGMSTMLAQPVPGGPRKMFTPEMVKAASGSNANDRVKVVEDMIAAASPEELPLLRVHLERAKAAASAAGQ